MEHSSGSPAAILKNLQGFGIFKTRHSQGTLVDHLIATHDMLRRWGCPEHLCLAGLCHSLYGTASFSPRRQVPLEKRPEVRALIGEEAENIAFLFSTHDKESLWRNVTQDVQHYSVKHRRTGKEISISKRELSDLVTLTVANWLEERPRLPGRRPFRLLAEFFRSRHLLPEPAFSDLLNAYGIHLSIRTIADGVNSRI